jgi:hypothetical protein
MPVYEPDMTPEDMDKAMDKFVCAECGGNLTRCWGGYYGHQCFMLRCSEDPTHEGLKPKGKNMEGVYINASLRGGLLPMETKELVKLNQDQMMERVNKARFPQELNRQEKALIATVSIEYGLDPVFGELMIYQGKPYITIDARRRKAQETGNLAGVNSRPATKEEREARGAIDGDYLFVCQVWVKGMEHPFEGWGKVRKAEIKGSEHLPIVKDPAAMAEKRAEAQALRRAFHIPLPSAEDIIEAEFTEIVDADQGGNGGKKTAPGSAKKAAAPAKAQPPQPRPENKNPITDAQKRKIQKDLEAAGHSELVVKAVLKTTFNVENIDDLTVPQASRFIDMIKSGEGMQVELMPEEQRP